MADTTTPTSGTPITKDPIQDLQINLEDAPKEEIKNSKESQQSEIDFNLDLNLSDLPKDDDRLKNEDKINETTSELTIELPQQEEKKSEIKFETPIEKINIEEPKINETTSEPVVEPKIEEIATTSQESSEIITQEIKVEKEKFNESTPEKISESNGEEIKIDPVIEPIIETKIEEPTATEIPQPTTVTEPKIKEVTTPPQESLVNHQESSEKTSEIPSPSTSISEQIISQKEAEKALHEDIQQIKEIETISNAGGLAPEAKVEEIKSNIPEQKTFDLDAMLGTPTTQAPTVIETPIINQIPTPTITETPGPTVVMQMPPLQMPPLQTPQTSVQTTTIPIASTTTKIETHHHHGGIKIVLLVLAFVGLGFGTFIVLKTMYPLEFNKLFSNKTSVIEQPGEDTLAETGTNESISSGEILTEETTGGMLAENDLSPTDTHSASEDNEFGELNDLEEHTNQNQEETIISKLTTYLNKGNDFLVKGKAINNPTIIKYSLYITKKTTAFLEKIANGEEITNVTGYLAQFDQYLTKLEALLNQSTEQPQQEVTTNETTSTISSPIIKLNESQESNTEQPQQEDTSIMTE